MPGIYQLQKEMMSTYDDLISSEPPPLKFAVLSELDMHRGDPAERRQVDAQITSQMDRIKSLEKALKTLRKEMDTISSVAGLKIQELESTIFDLKEENARLKLIANPQDTSAAEELLKIVAKEKATLTRERESVQSDKRQLEQEKNLLSSMKSVAGKLAIVNAEQQLSISSVIAQRVAEYMKSLEGCSGGELEEIRLGLEELLEQKIKQLESSFSPVQSPINTF